MMIKKISFAVIAAGSILSSMAIAQTCQLVKDVNFDNHSGSYSGYTQAMATSDFGTLEKNAAGDVRGLDRPGTTWPARNAVGQGVLRANYPANIAGGTNSGILFDQRFSDTDEAVLEYRLKFSKDFVWASGGKLPGLAGGTSRIPVGCTDNQDHIKNGFSARLMWRKNGKLVVYTYFPNRLSPNRPPGKCGIDIDVTTVQADRWYTVRQHIKMNTPGQKNGILRMYVDGQKRLDLANVEYRLSGKDNVRVNDFIFHTYRGGKATDTRFHSPKNEFIYFDDFKVWRNCSNPDNANGGGYTSRINLPGRVQAENYATAPVESTPGNQNSGSITKCTYHGLNVDVQDASEGTCNVGWTSAGEKLTYRIGAAGGNYNIRARLASPLNGRRVNIDVNGSYVGTVTTNGVGWQSWANDSINNVSIPSNATITVTFVDGGVNLNYLDITAAGSSSSSSSSSSASSSSSSSSSSGGAGSCTAIAWRERTELNLNTSPCVTFDRSLAGKVLAIWDSESNTSCDFRGQVNAVDGSGSVDVNANYVKAENLSGRTFTFTPNNNCRFVRIRGY